jgi:hypothetical protein
MSFAKAVFQTKIYLMSPATLAQVPPAPIPTLISHNIIVKMCDVFRIWQIPIQEIFIAKHI